MTDLNAGALPVWISDAGRKLVQGLVVFQRILAKQGLVTLLGGRGGGRLDDRSEAAQEGNRMRLAWRLPYKARARRSQKRNKWFQEVFNHIHRHEDSILPESPRNFN